MRIIIAGSRNYTDEADFFARMNTIVSKNPWLQETTEVVSGTARGVDQLGERWAELYGISITKFPADWSKYGRSAGFRRNAEMAQHADGLVAFWDGVSPGTASMIDLAKGRGLKVHIEMV